VQKLDIERYLVEDLLMKPDKMCMAFGIEARVPYLDHRLAEYSFSIRPSLKLRGMTAKYILKKAMRGVLPPEIISRKKQPFAVPLDVWVGKDLRGAFEDLLGRGSIIREGIVEGDEVRRVFQKYPASKMYYGRQLWSLVNLELWHRIYMGGEEPSKIRI
jgi:asparagine synthase (glutamine-hydrolysing)